MNVKRHCQYCDKRKHEDQLNHEDGRMCDACFESRQTTEPEERCPTCNDKDPDCTREPTDGSTMGRMAEDIKSIWLKITNVCDRGKIRITLEINGRDHRDIFYSYPSQEEGVVSIEQNLTWIIRDSRKHDEAAQDLASVIEHALELGHLGQGSTRGWAIRALKTYRKAVGGVE